MAKSSYPKPLKVEKIDYGILGAAAEHYVMYRLLRMDMIAALAPAGAPNADIIVSDKNVRRVAAVQVKARRNMGSDRGWHMKAKHEGDDHVDPLLFYCFVQLGDDESKSPECWIVPSEKVADVLKRAHAAWAGKPGKDGKARDVESKMRRFLPSYEKLGMPEEDGWLDQFKDKWELIRQKTDASPLGVLAI